MLQLLAQLSTQWTFKCHCNFVCLLICFFANEELTFKMSVTSLSKRVFNSYNFVTRFAITNFKLLLH